MATRTVVCPECAEPLPYGRLACPSCGTLLASVAGTHRRSEPLATAELTEEPALEPDPATEFSVNAAERELEPTEAAAAHDSHLMPAVLAPWPEPEAPAEPEPDGPATAPAPSWPEPPAWPVPPVTSASSSPPDPQRTWSPPPVDAAEPASDEVPYVPAGAYMPPSAAFADPLTPSSTAAGAAGAAALPEKSRRPGDAPLLADLPLDAPDDLPGWLVASGAAAAVVGFFLPWAFRVIGSSGDGFFSQWGFGAIMNLPVFVLVLVVLGLAVVPNSVPAWLRTGALALVAGGLLLGLAWPYVLYGPLNGRFGSLVEAFAGLVLILGGLLALRSRRHAGRGPTV